MKKTAAMKKDASYTLSPCQIVAWNLQKIRRIRGLSQSQAAAKLEPYLGHRLSRAAFSQAERCLQKGRIRRFDADEIVAFARAFEIQIPFFFCPPEPHLHGRPVAINGKPGGRRARVSSPALTLHEMARFAQGLPSQAKLMRIAEVASTYQQAAIARAVYRYLKENPDRLAEILGGKLPQELREALKRDLAINRTAHSESVLAERAREKLGFKTHDE